MRPSEIAKFNNCLVIIPLDHDLHITADYQYQTTCILRQQYSLPTVGYQAYLPQLRPWQRTTFSELVTDQDQIPLFRPLHLLPFERIPYIYSLNRVLSFVFFLLWSRFTFQKKKVLLWIFHPRFYWTQRLVELIYGKMHTHTIYDCLDYLSSAQQKEEQLLRKGEQQLFNSSQLVIFNSEFLAQKHSLKRKTVAVSPSGFVVPASAKVPERNSTARTKIVGYAGALNYRIDYELMIAVCRSLPTVQFHFYGPVYSAEEDQAFNIEKKRAQLLSLPNVKHSPQLDHEQMYQVMSKWDVGIIPYNLQVPLNYYCKPLKLYEYFYLGLPVVSVPIKSITNYSSFVSFVTTTNEWVSSINQLLTKKFSESELEYMREEALKNSWQNKLDFIFSKLEKQLSSG